MTRRPFSPAPFTPGAAIEWTHYSTDGVATVRTGIVWDRAPEVPGARIVCWVVPDDPRPTDIYSAVAVGKCARRGMDANGTGAYHHTLETVPVGSLFSSDYNGSPTAALAQTAANAAAYCRRRAS